MSDQEYEPPASALSSAEQAKGKRTILGISTVYLGIAVVGFAGV